MTTGSPAAAAREPLVSVCMPAYNATRWIREAIQSVLAQTYESFELVISDNCSTDDTFDVASSYRDTRIRIHRGSRHISAVDNHNRSVQLSRGESIKFLHADDLLLPDCLDANVALAREDTSVGLVFSPRQVILEMQDEAWMEEFARPHERFDRLDRVNEGPRLFGQLLGYEFELNLVGEPSATFVTRSCLARVGLFNPRLHQIADLELWARIMLTHRVGFIDRELAAYRHHDESVTAENVRYGRDWLDRVWLAETLLQQQEVGKYRQQVERLRRKALRRALRAQAGRVLRRRLDAQLLGYARFRARARLGHAPRLYPALDDPPPA